MSTTVLRLPVELRVAIYDLVVDESEIVLPGPLDDAVSGLVLASKQTSSEVIPRLWKASQVTWQGTVTSKAWQRFRKVVMPQIRNLTIVVNTDPKNGFGLDNEYDRLLQWMCRRCRPAMRARYDWKLQNLTLIDSPHDMNPFYALWDCVGQRWVHDSGRQLVYFRGMHWSTPDLEQYFFSSLRGCGVEVTADVSSLALLLGFGGRVCLGDSDGHGA